MEYCPSSSTLYGSVQEQAALLQEQVSPAFSSHYNSMTFESFCSYLPQASAGAMEVTLADGAGDFAGKEGDEAMGLQSEEEYSPSMVQEQLTLYCEHASAMSNYTNMIQSDLSEWGSSEPSHQAFFLAEQVQPLLALQGILKSQYGLSLTLDELLAFDALPALLHDTHAADPSEVFVLPQTPTQEPLLSHKQSAAMLATTQSTSTSSPLCFTLDPPFKTPQDVSSPGSATSSALTDNESSHDYRPLPALECHMNASFLPTSLPSPLPSLFSPPCLNAASMPWLSGADVGACISPQEDVEVIEPPAQRRKLHGITLEQVIQAEKSSPVFAHTIMSNPFLSKRDAALTTNVDMGACDGAMQPNLLHSIRNPTAIVPASSTRLEDVQSQSVAARKRRQKIREKTESLKYIIPGAARLDTAAMFDLAIKYVDFLQAQMVCLENEVSLTQQRASQYMSSMGEDQESFRRALIHRLLSSNDVQHFLSKEGFCIVTQGLASRLNFDPSSLYPLPPAGRTI